MTDKTTAAQVQAMQAHFEQTFLKPAAQQMQTLTYNLIRKATHLMTNPLIFQNPGLIELAAVTTMGVSIKDAGAIGYFGTGLKFAIATILRLGGSIRIYRGLDCYEFTTQTQTIAKGEVSKDFEIVCMNGQPLGFTTALGRNWSGAMAYREIACNCMDEKGNIYEAANGWDGPYGDQTTIVVQCDNITDAHRNRHEIFLINRDLLFSNSSVEIHRGASSKIFYKGVAVADLQKKMAFTYNLLCDMTLTEDRTIKYMWSAESNISTAISQVQDEDLLTELLTVGDDYGEDLLDLGAFYINADQKGFDNLANELAYGERKTGFLNKSLYKAVTRDRFKTLTPADNIRLTGLYQSIFNKAVIFLEAAGYNIRSVPIVVLDSLGTNLHGAAHNGKIYISLLPFQKGTREVAATLLEEYLHIISGFTDCTREFQNVLFDNILIQAEKARGEPI